MATAELSLCHEVAFWWPCSLPDFISSWTFHSTLIPPEKQQDRYYPKVVFKEKLTILRKIEMF